MRLSGMILGAAAFMCLIATPQAFCADLVGTVSDAHNQAVSGVVITVTNAAGRVFGQAKTDSQGRYKISDLPPGTYQCYLNPLGTGFAAGHASADLDSSGRTMDWKVSAHHAAIASSNQGTGERVAGDPFGYTAGQFASLVTLGAAGAAAAAVSGYGAAGGFSSGSPGPISPSM